MGTEVTIFTDRVFVRALPGCTIAILSVAASIIACAFIPASETGFDGIEEIGFRVGGSSEDEGGIEFRHHGEVDKEN
jgi:hypothetical protein